MQAQSHGSGYKEVWQYPIDSDLQISTDQMSAQVRIVTAAAKQVVTLQERAAMGQLDIAWIKLSTRTSRSGLPDSERRSSSNRFSDLAQDEHAASHGTASGESRMISPSPSRAMDSEELVLLVFENQSRSTPLSSFKPAKDSGPLANSPWSLASGEACADVHRAQFACIA